MNRRTQKQTKVTIDRKAGAACLVKILYEKGEIDSRTCEGALRSLGYDMHIYDNTAQLYGEEVEE